MNFMCKTKWWMQKFLWLKCSITSIVSLIVETYQLDARSSKQMDDNRRSKVRQTVLINSKHTKPSEGFKTFPAKHWAQKTK